MKQSGKKNARLKFFTVDRSKALWKLRNEPGETRTREPGARPPPANGFKLFRASVNGITCSQWRTRRCMKLFPGVAPPFDKQYAYEKKK